jgi:N-acetylmuramoyl-L-alanine amidase
MKNLIVLISVALISSAFVFSASEGKPDKIVVIIDAGHGGKDPGNKTDTLSEAQINLQVANQILEIKKKERKNIEFIFTRKGDDFLELKDRIALIDKHKADLFISIHCDNYTDEIINGFEIFHPIKGDQIVGSKKYARLLEEALLKKKTPMDHKSTKPGEMFVITRAHCPAVIVNFGFLSNPNDLETVLNPEYQMAFAKAMVESINEYAEKIAEK